ncbi:MAG: MFS transporter [Caulobacteraceae bacterium]
MVEGSTPGLKGLEGYARFWWASSVSDFGTYITTLAIQVLIVVDLRGSAADVGLVSAARWLPYVMFGLLTGAFIDRVRRRPLLVTADLARAALLLAIPLLALSQMLSVFALAGFMSVFGLFSLVGDAASQAFLPRLVPPPLLTRANARLDQSSSVAQTSGPALAGGLISLIGAPWAVIVDAVSYLFSGLMLLGVGAQEPAARPRARGEIGKDIAEGLRWVYGHPTLAPLSVNTHAWFVCWGVAGAVMAPFVLKSVHMSPLALGLALSVAGIGGLAGSLMASQMGARFGVGRTVVACRALTAVAFGVLALTPDRWSGWPVLALGQLLLGLAMGAENANEMGFRQAVTPDRLQGRVNATVRSTNRAMIVFAAPLGGLLADQIGNRATLWIIAAGFAAVALALSLSRFAAARMDGTPAGL